MTLPVVLLPGSMCDAALTDRIPHARLSIVERAGHLSTIDQPEELTSLLSQWLNLCNTKQPKKGTDHECNQE